MLDKLASGGKVITKSYFSYITYVWHFCVKCMSQSL